MDADPEKKIHHRWTTEANNILHPAAGLERRPRLDGSSWTLLTGADVNKIIIKAVAFRSIFRVVQNFTQVELLFLGGGGLSGGGHI